MDTLTFVTIIKIATYAVIAAVSFPFLFRLGIWIVSLIVKEKPCRCRRDDGTT